MKSAKLFLLFLSVIFLSNCAHQAKIGAVAAPDQMTDYEGVVTSEKKQTVSIAHYDIELRGRTAFMIIVENYEDRPIDFSSNNISVMFEGSSVDWAKKEIYVETPFEVMMDVQDKIRSRSRRAKRDDTNQGFTGVLSGNSQAASSLSSISGGGSFTVMPTRNISSDARQMRIDNINTMRAQSFYQVPRLVIQPKIIMPNESASGVFVCDTSEMKDKLTGNFIISVKIGGDEHKFIFTRS